MKAYIETVFAAAGKHWKMIVLISLGFLVIYYAGLLVVTMLRFGEIPNYVVFHDVFHVYGLIFKGTPSLLDAVPILIDEPWFETGYKNPSYYGVATWSFMLIPPKMVMVLLMGTLLGVFLALSRYAKSDACEVKNNKRLFAAAGISSTFISLTSATLTWVVCCATPSWVVALAMLGMSASVALWLEPLGSFLTVAAFLIMIWIIFYQARQIIKFRIPAAKNS
ncbi:MAG: hypothetical protein PVJ63_12320 [Thioalkalispiraceae bacterium]|jgi:hypothetical protein